jgi:integrase
MTETIRQFTLKEQRHIWEDASEKHMKDSLVKLERFFNFQRYGERTLDSFKPRDIHLFFNWLEDDKNLAKATINRYAASISSVFKHAVNEEVIDHVPNFKWKKVKSERPMFISDKQVKQLYWLFNNSGKTWVSDLLTVGLQTGMRLGEILQVGDTAYISKCGKFVENLKCKNGDSRRVPLNQSAFKALERLGRVKDVFHHHSFYDLWREGRDRFAGGDKNFVFHLTRHTCASRLANEFSINTLVIGKILGHRSQATTAKYVHEDENVLLDIVDKLAS